MLTTRVLGISAGLVALLLARSAFAGHKFPDYDVRSVDDYPVTAEKGELKIGVQPIEDLKEQKTYFATELTPKGFIPVFVVIQNGSSADSFLFEKSNVGYAGVSSDPTPQVRSKVGESLVLLGPGLIAMALITNATEIEQNLVKKEIRSATLSPGTSLHGFLYIPAPKKGPRDKIHLQVPITKAGTNETYVLNLFF